jgi:hypothetical protein
MVAAMTSAVTETGEVRVVTSPVDVTDPKAHARQLIEEGQRLLDEALQGLDGASGRADAAGLVGRASDHVGSALYHLRTATRR